MRIWRSNRAAHFAPPGIRIEVGKLAGEQRLERLDDVADVVVCPTQESARSRVLLAQK